MNLAVRPKRARARGVPVRPLRSAEVLPASRASPAPLVQGSRSPAVTPSTTTQSVATGVIGDRYAGFHGGTRKRGGGCRPPRRRGRAGFAETILPVPARLSGVERRPGCRISRCVQAPLDMEWCIKTPNVWSSVKPVAVVPTAAGGDRPAYVAPGHSEPEVRSAPRTTPPRARRLRDGEARPWPRQGQIQNATHEMHKTGGGSRFVRVDEQRVPEAGCDRAHLRRR